MKTLHQLLTICFSSLLLISCGGGGGGSGTAAVTPSVTPASVGLIVTDASIDDWDQAITTITSVELIGDEGRHTLFSGRRTVDLLRLRDYVEVFEIDDNVTPGRYSKIRLRVERMRLVRLNDDGTVMEERDADLVANGKIDLNPRDVIDIAPGAVLFLTLDFDMDKSFKLTATGNGRLKLRPVIFVRVGTEPGFRNLARVQGVIARISDDYDGFLLCRSGLVAVPLSHDESDDNDDERQRCVRVATDIDTGVFGEDGLPFDGMMLMEGDAVTVVGRLGRRVDQPEVEPLSEHDVDEGDDDSNDDSSDDYRHDAFVLNAFVIETGLPGTWQRVAGNAVTAVADDAFGLAVDPAQGFAPDTVIDALLSTGTRIFNPRGIEQSRDAIAEGKRVVVDAVLALSNSDPDALRTALVIVGTDTPRESIEGELLSVDGSQLTLATDSGDRCVLTGGATVLRITSDDLDIDEIAIGDLLSGEMLEVFGAEDSGGCFAADVIVAKPTAQAP